MAVATAIIQANGSIPRPSLGLDHVDLTADAARSARLPVTSGAVVATVTPGGPAAIAGIQAGDVITSLGGTAITLETPLLNGLMAFAPDQSVHIVLNRAGRIIEVDVRLGKRA